MLRRDGAGVELDDAEQSRSPEHARVDPVPDLPERELAHVVELAHSGELYGPEG